MLLELDSYIYGGAGGGGGILILVHMFEIQRRVEVFIKWILAVSDVYTWSLFSFVHSFIVIEML